MQGTFMKFAVGIAAGAIALFAGGEAQALSVSGSIAYNSQTGVTSVDYWDFTANSAGNVIIDVLSRNINFGNGASGLDSQLRLFQNDGDGSLDLSDYITGNDDAFGVADTNGSVSGFDSYLSVFLNPGNYRLAISDFFFSTEEAIAGLQTDNSSFGGVGDYRIDFVGDVSATPIPTPALVPGAIAMSMGLLRKRKAQAAEAAAKA